MISRATGARTAPRSAPAAPRRRLLDRDQARSAPAPAAGPRSPWSSRSPATIGSATACTLENARLIARMPGSSAALYPRCTKPILRQQIAEDDDEQDRLERGAEQEERQLAPRHPHVAPEQRAEYAPDRHERALRRRCSIELPPGERNEQRLERGRRRARCRARRGPPARRPRSDRRSPRRRARAYTRSTAPSRLRTRHAGHGPGRLPTRGSARRRALSSISVPPGARALRAAGVSSASSRPWSTIAMRSQSWSASSM